MCLRASVTVDRYRWTLKLTPGFADVCRQLSLPSEPFHPPRRLSFYSVDLLILATDGLLVGVPLMACQSSMNLVLF